VANVPPGTFKIADARYLLRAGYFDDHMQKVRARLKLKLLASGAIARFTN